MSNLERAAEIIHLRTHNLGMSVARSKDRALLAARALDADGLLMPDDVAEEWEAVVAWRNKAGQTEQQHGRGVTRDEALDDARAKQHWLTDPTEIAHKCAVRHVTPWVAEDVTHIEHGADDE